MRHCPISFPGSDGSVRIKEFFIDLDFADDLILLVKMLSVLVLALEVINVEACPLGLSINWAKTKMQYFSDPDGVPMCATVQGNQVESFTYLGSLVHSRNQAAS